MMKHRFSTIAVALLLTTNYVAAFNGGDAIGLAQTGPQKVQMKQNGQDGNANKVDNKKSDEAKRKAAEEANKRNVSAQGGMNEAQLMTPEGNADSRTDLSGGRNDQSQQGQQNMEPSQTQSDTTSSAEEYYGAGDNLSADNNADKDNSIWSGNLKWMLLAVVVIVVAYFLTRKKPVGKGRKKDAYKEEPSAEMKLIEALRNDVRNLIDNLNALRQQNESLRNEVNALRPKPVANTSAIQTQNNNVRAFKPKKDVLYANILNGMVFPTDNMQQSRDEYTVFVLTVSGNEGTFKVNDAQDAQVYLISNFAYSVASAVDVKSKSTNAKAIVTVEPGRVSKTGSGWTIVKKAVVELR